MNGPRPVPFLKLASRAPDGNLHIVELDEAGAATFLTEMETWGDECGDDAKALRERLRQHFSGELPARTILTPAP